MERWVTEVGRVRWALPNVAIWIVDCCDQCIVPPVVDSTAKVRIKRIMFWLLTGLKGTSYISALIGFHLKVCFETQYEKTQNPGLSDFDTLKRVFSSSFQISQNCSKLLQILHLSTTWPSERTVLWLSDSLTRHRPLSCTSTPPPMSISCIGTEWSSFSTETLLGVSTFPGHFPHHNSTCLQHGQRGSGKLFGLVSSSRRL